MPNQAVAQLPRPFVSYQAHRSLNAERRIPNGPSVGHFAPARTTTVRVATLTDGNTFVLPVDLLTLGVLTTVQECDSFVADIEALGGCVQIYPSGTECRIFRITSTDSESPADWYKILLCLIKWQSESSFSEMDVRDFPDHLDISWFGR